MEPLGVPSFMNFIKLDALHCINTPHGRLAAINWHWLVPRRKGQVFVFVGVVDGSLDVDDDGVVAHNFGGNVDGHDGEHGVSAKEGQGA